MEPIKDQLEGILLSLDQTSILKTEAEQICACEGTGWIPVPGDPDKRVKRCECQKHAIAEARIATILQDWKEYQDASIENTKARSIAQENALTILRDDPTVSYYFTGTYKRGKTRFLVCQYRRLALAGELCILRSARDLMEELRRAEVAAAPDRAPEPSPVLRMITSASSGHLFIDDIEKVANTGFRTEMLWDILDTIKRRELRISMSSNLPMIAKDGRQDLKAKLGSEIISRIYQLCKVVEL